MKISTVPMALREGEPPWYHEMVPENGKWVERWVQYEEGDLPEEEPEKKDTWLAIYADGSQEEIQAGSFEELGELISYELVRSILKWNELPE